MVDILFTQSFYIYLILFFLLLIGFSFLSYISNEDVKLIDGAVLIFALFTTVYIGGRDFNVGVDTMRYQRAFDFYQRVVDFRIRKDVFYDLLAFLFAKLLDFRSLLYFCACIYVCGAMVGFRKIFGNYGFLAFSIFLISPYFISNGISAMRSGVAASLFILGLGAVFKRGSFRHGIVWFVLGVLFHVSMIVPLVFFIVSRYYKNTKFIFSLWLFSILLGYLKINVIVQVVDFLGIFESRIGDYAVNEGERNYWTNFFIFGFGPVLFSIYNILVLRYRDDFYTWISNAFMMIHIPYIILIESEYGLRLGYLAEFMLPILIVYPLVKNPKLNFRFVRIKLTIIIFCIFLIKAYKILVI